MMAAESGQQILSTATQFNPADAAEADDMSHETSSFPVEVLAYCHVSHILPAFALEGKEERGKEIMKFV